MLDANCTSCHGSAIATSGINLSTYASVKANAAQANTQIQAGNMPPGGGLSAADKQMFQSWVSAGEPDN